MPTDREIALTRSNQGWPSAPEPWIVAWIVRRLPRWMVPDLPTAIGFVAAVGDFLLLRVAFSLKPPVPLDIAWIAANPGLYVMGRIGQLGHLAGDEPRAGKDRQKRMPALA